MAFVLTRNDDNYTGAIGQPVTISVSAANTDQWLVAARYNGTAIPVDDAAQTTKFTMVAGDAELALYISGNSVIPDTLDVGELDPANGMRQHLYGYLNNYMANINLTITGV